MAEKSAKGEIAQDERLKHIAGWKKSGLAKDDYCQQNGISRNQLSYWLRSPPARGSKVCQRKSAFARVTVTKHPATPLLPALTAMARLVVGGGAILEIDGSVDPIWAARVIAAVGGRQ